MGKYVNGVYVPDEEEYNKWTHPKGNVEEVQPVVEPYKHQNTTLNKTTQVTEPYKPTTEPGLQSWDQVLGKQRAADMGLVPEQYGKPNQAAVSTYAPKMRVTPQDAELANSMAVEAQEKRNMFRVAPTADQAKMVGAAPLSENEVAARAQQLERDAIKREQQQKAIDPNDPKAGLEAINANWTSKEDEEKYRKASVARQRIMAVADALRHIGNIYHTAKYAPSQKFNSPVEQERTRYQQEKALRDKANERIMTYQMAKQKMDNDQNRWEAEQKQKQANWNATYKYNQEKDAADRAEKQRQYNLTLELNKQKAENQRKYQEEQVKLGHERNKIARGHLGAAWKNANTAAERVKIMKDYYQSGGRGGYRTGSGYNYATKNGYVTLKSDYLKNNINKESIVNQMKNSNFVDDEWKKQYEIAKWTNQDDEMLDEAISNWLMNDDNAEYWMKEHFGDNGGVHVPLAGTMPGVANGESGTTMPGVKQ